MNKVKYDISLYYLYCLFLLKWCVNGVCVDDLRVLFFIGKI